MKVQSLTLLTLVFGITAFGGQRTEAEDYHISAIINAAQETPAPVGVPASAAGFATVHYDDITKELSWNVAWQDLSDPPTGMHFHAPAGLGSNAGVAVNIGSVSGLISPSVGSTVVTDAFSGDLLGGLSYINLHTAQNASGEIRGQVSPQNINLSAVLNSAQEILPSPAGVLDEAGGMARMAFDPTTNTLGWNIEWEGLSGLPTGMHFHGPAGVEETAGVRLNIGSVSGLTSPSIGSAVISDLFANELLSGQWYINIHTALNGAGEIRGQVVPEPGSASLALLALLGILGACQREKRI